MNFVRQNPYTFAFIHPDFSVAENGIHTSLGNEKNFKRTLAVGNAEDIVVFKCCVVIRFAVLFFKEHIITFLKIVKFFCYYITCNYNRKMISLECGFYPAIKNI
jgi:hypothetical protein